MHPSSPTSVVPASGFDPFLEFLYDSPENIPLMYHTETTYVRVRSSIRSLVVETNVPSAKGDELLREYAGREDQLLKNLEKRKLEREKEAGTIEEIKALVEETNAPKSAEELMAAYEGRYGDLLKFLRKMKAYQRKLKAYQGKKASIRSIRSFDVVTSVGETKSTEELLETCKKEEKEEEIRSLISRCNIDKSADHLMRAYEGKDDELLENLRRMSSARGAKKAKDAEKEEEIRSLIARCNIDKSAGHLMKVYEGKEDALLKNLHRMSRSQGAKKAKDAEKEEEIRSLISRCNTDKSAGRLMKAYEGKNDTLLKNLRGTSSLQGAKKAKDAEQEEEIRSLIARCNIDMSAGHLMKAYEGKDDLLLKNLRRMSNSRGAKRAKDAEKEEEIRSLISRCNIDKSAGHLMKAYEGKDDELLKNLRRMNSSQGAENGVQPPLPLLVVFENKER